MMTPEDAWHHHSSINTTSAGEKSMVQACLFFVFLLISILQDYDVVAWHHHSSINTTSAGEKAWCEYAPGFLFFFFVFFY